MDADNTRLTLQRLHDAVQKGLTADRFIDSMQDDGAFALGALAASHGAEGARVVSDVVEYFGRAKLMPPGPGGMEGLALPDWDAPATMHLRGRLAELLREHLERTAPAARPKMFALDSVLRQHPASSPAPGPGVMSGPPPAFASFAGSTLGTHRSAFPGRTAVDALNERDQLEAIRKHVTQLRIEQALAIAEQQAEPMRVLREIRDDLRAQQERAHAAPSRPPAATLDHMVQAEVAKLQALTEQYQLDAIRQRKAQEEAEGLHPLVQQLIEGIEATPETLDSLSPPGGQESHGRELEVDKRNSEVPVDQKSAATSQPKTGGNPDPQAVEVQVAGSKRQSRASRGKRMGSIDKELCILLFQDLAAGWPRRIQEMGTKELCEQLRPGRKRALKSGSLRPTRVPHFILFRDFFRQNRRGRPFELIRGVPDPKLRGHLEQYVGEASERDRSDDK